MEMNLERLILVGGTPSSGTTLLSVMLDAHPDIFCGPELGLLAHPAFYREGFKHYSQHLLNSIDSCPWEKTDALLNLQEGFCPYALMDTSNLSVYDLDGALLKQLLQNSVDSDEFIRNLFTPMLTRHGKAFLAEKSPQNLYAFDSFLGRFPQGRVLYMVRDPRAVAASLIRRGMSLRHAIAIWLLESAICERLDNHPRAMRVRYEDLILDTAVVLGDIFRFLDVSQDVKAALEYSAHSSRIKSDQSISRISTWTANPSQPISREPLESWRGVLDQASLAVMEQAVLVAAPAGLGPLVGIRLRDLVQKLGYAWEPSVAPPEAAVKLLLSERLIATRHQAYDVDISEERFVESAPSPEIEQSSLWQAVIAGLEGLFQKETPQVEDLKSLRAQLTQAAIRESELHDLANNLERQRADMEGMLARADAAIADLGKKIDSLNDFANELEEKRAGAESVISALSAELARSPCTRLKRIFQRVVGLFARRS
jgi:hypothetical protein